MGQQNQRNLRCFAPDHLGQFCLRYIAASLENHLGTNIAYVPCAWKILVRWWILIGYKRPSREWWPDHWRNCPNRTNPKPLYTFMISNVITTLHSYNGTDERFLQLTDWDRELARPMISIVDDDDFVRESLRDLIESLGHDVATFGSAERF